MAGISSQIHIASFQWSDTGAEEALLNSRVDITGVGNQKGKGLMQAFGLDSRVDASTNMLQNNHGQQRQQRNQKTQLPPLFVLNKAGHQKQQQHLHPEQQHRHHKKQLQEQKAQQQEQKHEKQKEHHDLPKYELWRDQGEKDEEGRRWQQQQQQQHLQPEQEKQRPEQIQGDQHLEQLQRQQPLTPPASSATPQNQQLLLLPVSQPYEKMQTQAIGADSYPNLNTLRNLDNISSTHHSETLLPKAVAPLELKNILALRNGMHESHSQSALQSSSKFEKDQINSEILQRLQTPPRNQHQQQEHSPLSQVISDTSSLDSDKELELYSRQIQLEIRQREMLELAAEAERAAEAGQESFTGRASTFGDDNNNNLLVGNFWESENAATAERRRNHTESDQSATKLRNRAYSIIPRRNKKSSMNNKLGVLSLRHVNEVVPSFHEFHMHLRTHFVRQNVDKKSLIFDEVSNDAPLRSANGCGGSDAGVHAISFLTNFNFASWGSTGRTQDDDHLTINTCFSEVGDLLAEHLHNSAACRVAANHLQKARLEIPHRLGLPPASADPTTNNCFSEVGDLLAEHLHSNSGTACTVGAQHLRKPRLEIPDGLELPPVPTVCEQEGEQERGQATEGDVEQIQERGTRLGKISLIETTDCNDYVQESTLSNQGVSTLETVPTTFSSESMHGCGFQHSSSSAESLQDLHNSKSALTFTKSLPSNEDLDTNISGTPLTAATADVESQETETPPSSPRSSLENTLRITSKQRNMDVLLLTPTDTSREDRSSTAVASAFNGSDFVTPARLRDIRDESANGLTFEKSGDEAGKNDVGDTQEGRLPSARSILETGEANDGNDMPPQSLSFKTEESTNFFARPLSVSAEGAPVLNLDFAEEEKKQPEITHQNTIYDVNFPLNTNHETTAEQMESSKSLPLLYNASTDLEATAGSSVSGSYFVEQLNTVNNFVRSVLSTDKVEKQLAVKTDSSITLKAVPSSDFSARIRQKDDTSRSSNHSNEGIQQCNKLEGHPCDDRLTNHMVKSFSLEEKKENFQPENDCYNEESMGLQVPASTSSLSQTSTIENRRDTIEGSSLQGQSLPRNQSQHSLHSLHSLQMKQSLLTLSSSSRGSSRENENPTNFALLDINGEFGFSINERKKDSKVSADNDNDETKVQHCGRSQKIEGKPFDQQQQQIHQCNSNLKYMYSIEQSPNPSFERLEGERFLSSFEATTATEEDKLQCHAVFTTSPDAVDTEVNGAAISIHAHENGFKSDVEDYKHERSMDKNDDKHLLLLRKDCVGEDIVSKSKDDATRTETSLSLLREDGDLKSEPRHRVSEDSSEAKQNRGSTAGAESENALVVASNEIENVNSAAAEAPTTSTNEETELGKCVTEQRTELDKVQELIVNGENIFLDDSPDDNDDKFEGPLRILRTPGRLKKADVIQGMTEKSGNEHSENISESMNKLSHNIEVNDSAEVEKGSSVNGSFLVGPLQGAAVDLVNRVLSSANAPGNRNQHEKICSKQNHEPDMNLVEKDKRENVSSDNVSIINDELGNVLGREDHGEESASSVSASKSSFIEMNVNAGSNSAFADNIFIENRIETELGSDGDSKQAGRSKKTADLQCQCLISPASSLESDEAGIEVEDFSGKRPSENLWVSKNRSQKPLLSAVAMLSHLSKGGVNQIQSEVEVVVAPPEENDAFLNNYMYCSKKMDPPTDKVEPVACAEPCQDTKIPCGDIVVDACVGNLMDSACNIFPKKKVDGRKPLCLGRNKSIEKTRPDNWFDLANERFDGLVDRLLGNAKDNSSQWRISFQAPSLKETRTSPPTPLSAGTAAVRSSAATGNDTSTSSLSSSAATRSAATNNDSDTPIKSSFLPSVVVDYDGGSIPSQQIVLLRPSTSEDSSSVFHLPPERRALSDEQFALIYGMSREQYVNRTNKVRTGEDQLGSSSGKERANFPQQRMAELPEESPIGHDNSSLLESNVMERRISDTSGITTLQKSELKRANTTATTSTAVTAASSGSNWDDQVALK